MTDSLTDIELREQPEALRERLGQAPPTESLEEFAQRVAEEHEVSTIGPRPAFLLAEMPKQRSFLQKAYQYYREASAEVLASSYAAEWLLDNYYLIERAWRLLNEGLPEGYYRQLPRLAATPLAGYPRVYAVARAVVQHTQGAPAIEALQRFVHAYQQARPLTMGELWALPLMLRLVSLEDVIRAVARLTGLSAPRLATPALLLDVPDDVLVGNSIHSLRVLDNTAWEDFFDSVSRVEQMLRGDPVDVYRHMVFETRDRYRRAVERIARRSRRDEEQVAQAALRLAHQAAPRERVEPGLLDLNEQGARADGKVHAVTQALELPRSAHIGYYLIDEGQAELEAALSYRPGGWRRLHRALAAHPLVVYLGGIAALAGLLILAAVLYALSAGATPLQAAGLALIALVPAVAVAVNWANWLVTRMVPPRVLPRLDLSDGLPAGFRSMVVIPTLLTSRAEIADLLQQMERHYLANHDDHLTVALLTDFADAPGQHQPEDAALVAEAQAGVAALNQRYASDGQPQGPFYLFHRERRWNGAEGCWMGWERKRGKLMEFNRLLRGDVTTSYVVQEGDLTILPQVRYVITLDADTILPRDGAASLVAILAHPLNRAVFDPYTGEIVAGYTVLQPRVEVKPTSAERSLFARLCAGDTGLDLYTRAVSDVYQDLFGEGIYVGKGIYDVDAFERSLAGKVPDNALLSHDLFEGTQGRVALVTDVTLIEDYPAHYLAYMRRMHRWARGDWQLTPWLLPSVRESAGEGRAARLSTLDTWKILDNLRRSLLLPALVLWWASGWLWLPGSPLVWTLAGLLVLSFWNETADAVIAGLSSGSLAGIGRSLRISVERQLFFLIMAAHQALVYLNAILVTVWRLTVSRRHLLEWTSAAHTASALSRQDAPGLVWREMAGAPALALALGLLVAAVNPPALPYALPLLLLWFISPQVAYRVSQPLRYEPAPLSDAEREALRRLSRRTWLFFEEFVGPADHWLPPDHFQQSPRGVTARRTSPTNIGLLLLANVSARDLGYIGAMDLALRLRYTLDTIDQLEKYQGHLLNWYATQDLAPLPPRYVSTVDSGNLVACLIALRQACLELPHQPTLSWANWQGLLDTLAVLDEVLGGLARASEAEALGAVRRQLGEMTQQIRQAREDPAAWPALLVRLNDTEFAALERLLVALIEAERVALDAEGLRSLRIWLERSRRHLANTQHELTQLTPWSLMLRRPPEWLPAAAEANPAAQAAWQALSEALPVGLPYDAIAGNLDDAREALAHLQTAVEAADLPAELTRAAGPWFTTMLAGLNGAGRRVAALLNDYQAIADHAERLVQATNFRFLFDAQREVLYIGYNVDAGRIDEHRYDLLASEARIASLVAIARGQVPQSHWLHLSRPFIAFNGQRALLSWSGTMFEYLMPDLLIHRYQDTLLSTSCRVAVDRQIAYGQEQRLPWGVSESGYYRFDADLNYQYRAFGVPGLGFDRGMAEHRVVTPYASLLALPYRPQEVVRNIDRLIDLRMLGRYGLFEAIDYTRSRLDVGQDYAIVQSYMAHHQGMILLSLANYLLEGPIVRRFHADQRIQTVELLLQEQIPQRAPIEEAPTEDAGVIRPAQPQVAIEPWAPPLDTPLPQVHLLSNGRYSVLLTQAGGGVSRWNGLDLTRWRADTTLDDWGMWVYFRDDDSGELWSLGHQPLGGPADGQEALFAAHMAAFQRQARGIASRMEVTVALDDDVEVRQMTVTNIGNERRRLQVTSYAEVVLGSGRADRQHQAFNKLFIESEYLPEVNGLLFRRRPRSAEEEPVYLLHLLVIDGDALPSGLYESDRARFLGRGRTPRAPAALIEGAGQLAGATGATLDPIMALGQMLDLEPHATARLAYITLAADSREEALRLAGAYRNWATIERAFEHGRMRIEGELRQAGITTPALASFQQLLSPLLYPHAALRAEPAALAANTKGQPSLWPYAISGDYPILLVRVRNTEEAGVIQELLQAHSYWRKRQIKIDLVILNEHDAGYAQELQNHLYRLIGLSGSDAWLNARGGVFLLRADLMAPADRILLETAARVILDGQNGALAGQLAPLRRVPLRLPALVLTRDTAVQDPTPPLERPQGLLFDNGLGGFTPDGKEYVIYLRPGETTPLPWVNVIANEGFGFLVSEAGGGYTWAGNSGENRLTPWANDPVSDAPGEALYLRDEETGEVWSPTPLPADGRAPYLIRHGAGYSTFEHHSFGLVQRLRLFAAPDAPVKVIHLRLENPTDRPRRVTATYYAEWVLYTTHETAQPYVIPAYDAERKALLASNPYNTEFGGRVAFLSANKDPHGLTADRTEFLGRNGHPARPAALDRVGLEGRVEAGNDPCAALQLHLDLPPGGAEEIYFILGEGANREEALRLAGVYREPEQVEAAWQAAQQRWADLLGTVTVETPDPAMDVALNRWLLYQALSCRIWGRSALYQSSGAYGFRDQLQDVMGLIHAAPELARAHILRSAHHQFAAGDVLHWWHPPSGRGVRTRISDDLLWLPYVVEHYIRATGDESILDETAPFLQGPELQPGQEDRYDHYLPGDDDGTLYEHCVRAIERGATKGEHGLPLIGTGDWNDGMNRVGHEGRGESVWLGWFLYAVLTRFAEVCARRGDTARAGDYRQRAADLQKALEEAAWDGAWYRRAYDDEGEPLGAEENRECKIDSIAQSWAVLSGAGRHDRAVQAMNAVSRWLVRRKEGLILLFTPPFDKTPRDPGYIKGYLPGIRENGGQYTHAAIWTVWAYAELGQGDYAAELYALLNPVNHGDTPDKVERYRVEPYVIAADVYGVAPHVGRGGWTWYTGSASWFYRLGLEGILGLRREGAALRLDPSIPARWPGFRLRYRYGATWYDIRVANPDGVERGVKRVRLDGRDLPDGVIPLVDDGAAHEATVTMG